MYFKFSLRHNPATSKTEGYYRLVESYRDERGRVSHKTLLNVGFIDKLVDIEQLNQIRRILCNRYEESLGQSQLFEIKPDNEAIVNQLVEEYWGRLVNENRIDIGQQKTKPPTVKQRRMVDSESIRNFDVREIGSEWLCYQALEQLQLLGFLTKIGFDDESMRLAITQIISRAVYPASELETTRWIRENSAVCEITQYPLEKLTKDRLYKSSLKLFEHKNEIEKYLSVKTNQLFDIQDKIYLFDLTNTYFEGKIKHSKLAKYGRSKEKRSDCKIVVLAMVINVEGFIKYSCIFSGNMQDPQTLENIVKNLRNKTSETAKKAIVVIDAGIATKDNLKMLTDNEFDYICVSRSKLKKYKIVEGSKIVEVEDKKHQKISLQKVESEQYNDYFLKVESEGKRQKEESMNNRFQERFESGLKAISASLSKKSGIKIEQKVLERIGRLKQKYQSIHKYYDISYDVETEVVRKRKTNVDTEIRKVKSLSWCIKDNVDVNQRSGTYFLRTSLDDTETIVWEGYNVIREIESCFRTLKTDLDLRPIYHKRDDATMAHLNLGLLAYWVVNTIRFQLKRSEEINANKQTLTNKQSKDNDNEKVETSINFCWKEIVRTLNTQKAVTTTAQNNYEEVIFIRRCSEPNPKVLAIYQKLKYKIQPFSKRKFVVHKAEMKKMEYLMYQAVMT
ncbi:MAG: IS1634 family transposase [Bacteroidales bacterium]|jgi:hypothetical protein|nr:IS1634 family transposase [Bacteroidales bacterium]